MSTRNFPYWKARTKNLGEPKKSIDTGIPRKVANMDYNQNIVSHLAYNGCTRLRDEATGELFNYSKKNHLLQSYVAAPPRCSWSADRAGFANTLMAYCRKKHPRARLGRSIVAACPDGLGPEKFINESIAYANYLSARFQTTVFVDIHDPKKSDPDADEIGRNIHAHFFFPSYTVTPQGFGKKEKLRDLDLKTKSPKIVEELRQEWAHCMERGFKMQGDNAAKIEHRSYERQYKEKHYNNLPCIKRLPQPKIGSAARAMDERGETTDRMKLLQEVERHNERLEQLEAEEKALQAEIERLEALPNTRIPARCIGIYTVDDHVNQRSYPGTHAYAQRTYDWLGAG